MRSIILAGIIAATPAAAMSKTDKDWLDNLAYNFVIAKTSADFCPGVELNKTIFLSKMANIKTKKDEDYFFARIDFQAEDLMAYLRENDVKQWCADQLETLKAFRNSEAPVFLNKPVIPKSENGS